MRERIPALVLLTSSLFLFSWLSVDLWREQATMLLLQILNGEDQRTTTILEGIRQGDAAYVDRTRVTSGLADSHRTLARRATDRSVQVSELCRELGVFGAGLREEPFAPELLIPWSSTRELLGGVRCDLPYTEGSSVDILSFTESIAPNDLTSIAAAGIMSLRRGRKEAGARLLRRYMALGGLLTEQQQLYVLEFIREPGDVPQFFPPKLAVLFPWIRLVQIEAPERYHGLFPAFETLFSGGIDEAHQFSTRGELPDTMLERWLLTVQDFELDSPLRQRVDLMLGELYSARGMEGLATFFTSRSRLATTASVVGTSERSADPSFDSLSRWGSDERITLDSTGTGIGVFVPSPHRVQRLELWADGSELPRGFTEGIRVLGSSDNFSYQVVDVSSLGAFRIGSRVVVALTVPLRDFPFWKVVLPEGPFEERFSGAPRSLLRVFGGERS